MITIPIEQLINILTCGRSFEAGSEVEKHYREHVRKLIMDQLDFYDRTIVVKVAL